MPQKRAIEGEPLAFALQRRRDGAACEKIARELAAKFDLAAISERTLRRTFLAHGIEAPKQPRRFTDPAMAVLRSKLADNAAKAPGSPAAASTPPEVTTPDRKPAGAAFDERATLLRHIAALELDMTLAIPPHDRATVARTIAGMAARVSAIDAAALRARTEKEGDDADGNWVRKRLEHFVDVRRRAQEAAMASMSPSEQAAARRVLDAGDANIKVVALDAITGEEGPHAEAG